MNFTCWEMLLINPSRLRINFGYKYSVSNFTFQYQEML